MNKIVIEAIGRWFVFTYPIISLIGFIFNTISFIIFSRRKFHKTSFSIYYRFLIISDTLALLLPLNRMLELNFNIKMQNVSDFLCVIRVFYSYIFIAISGWTTVIISLDRACSIIYSNRYLFRKKSKFRLLVCLFVLAFNILFYSPTTIDSKINVSVRFNDNQSNQTIISKSCKSDQVYMFWMDLFNSDLVPFVLMITFTYLTVRFIHKSRTTAGSSVNKKDMKFASTSITLNVIFLILNSPYCFYTLLVDSLYVLVDPYLENLLFIIFLTLLYLNSCSVFFINYKVNSIFRKELLEFFSKIYGKNESYNQQKARTMSNTYN